MRLQNSLLLVVDGLMKALSSPHTLSGLILFKFNKVSPLFFLGGPGWNKGSLAPLAAS